MHPAFVGILDILSIILNVLKYSYFSPSNKHTKVKSLVTFLDYLIGTLVINNSMRSPSLLMSWVLTAYFRLVRLG